MTEHGTRLDPKTRLLVNSYLKAIDRVLGPRYTYPDGSTAMCRLIALDVADFAQDCGAESRVVTIQRPIPTIGSEGPSEERGLLPSRYNGAVWWGAHVVCVIDDEVADPVHGPLTSKAVYLASAFGVSSSEVHLRDRRYAVAPPKEGSIDPGLSTVASLQQLRSTLIRRAEEQAQVLSTLEI